MKGKRFRERTINYWLLGTIFCLLLVIVLGAMAYIRATRPMNQAQADAVKIAKEHANLKEMDDFYWFNREKSYFTIVGKNTDDENIIVIIPKSGEKIRVLDPKDGLYEFQVRQLMEKEHPKDKVKKVALGIYNDQTAWEVTAENSQGELIYYLLDFTSGKEIKTVDNL